ncbi:MAG TPA: EamA family transporter, partial [Neisseria sp.]|nr:EamA family transporter [Neisseria sp.]
MMNDHITSAHFDLWQTIRSEAAAAAAAEPMLASFLHLTVLRHHSLDRVLAFHLSSKLSSPIMDARALFEVYLQALQSDGDIIKAVEKDILACYERDPACDEYSLPLLYFKGFHAVQAHRINHWLWQQGRKTLAYFLQNAALKFLSSSLVSMLQCTQPILTAAASYFLLNEK